MKDKKIEEMDYDELLKLSEDVMALLPLKKLEKERKEIKKAMSSFENEPTVSNFIILAQNYINKGGDIKELLLAMNPLIHDAPQNTENAGDTEEPEDVELMDKETYLKSLKNDFSIEEVLNIGRVNHILYEGNMRQDSENFPDPVASRVVDPHGVLPCLTTSGSCYVDVRELECGATSPPVSNLRNLLRDSCGTPSGFLRDFRESLSGRRPEEIPQKSRQNPAGCVKRC